MTQIEEKKKFSIRQWWKSLTNEQQRPIIIGAALLIFVMTLPGFVGGLFKTPEYEVRNLERRAEWMEAVVVAFAQDKMQTTKQDDGSVILSGASLDKSFIVILRDDQVYLSPVAQLSDKMNDHQ